MSSYNNKLRIWVYGCSFTFGNWVDDLQKPVLCGETWPYLLDIGSQYEIENRSKQGGSWDLVKDRILKDIPYYSKEDLLIIQVPQVTRFYNKFLDPNFRSNWQIRIHAEKECKEFYKLFGDRKLLFDDLVKDVQIILKLLNTLGIKFLFWYTDGQLTKGNKVSLLTSHFYNDQINFDKHSSYLDWIENYDNYRYSEHDFHQSELGHKEQAKIFTKYIKKKLLV